MAETHNMNGLDGTQSVSALGLRWAALRGMLNSPLIAVEDQRSLRDELLRELGTLERGFGGLSARNTVEISAKVDIAKSALQERLHTEQSWLVDLLDSIQADLQSIGSKTVSAPTQNGRPITNLTRHQQRAEESAATADAASSAA